MNVEIDQYFKTVEGFKKDGYEMMIDLTAVDWYRKKEPRFEVIVNLLSVSKNSRLIIKREFFDTESKLTITSNRGSFFLYQSTAVRSIIIS